MEVQEKEQNSRYEEKLKTENKVIFKWKILEEPHSTLKINKK